MAKIQIKELYSELQEKFNLSKRETEQFVNTFFEIIKEGVERDGQVKVKGLGTFRITTVDARESININTGERMVIDEHDKVSFTPDNAMKELVNRPFSLFDTVVLNDGVTFDDEDVESQPVEEENVDVQPSAPKEEAQPAVEVETQHAVELETQPAVEEDAQPAVEVETQPAVEDEAQPAVEVETQPAVEDEAQSAVEEASHPFISDEDIEDDESDDESGRANWWKWLCAAVLLVLVCGLGYVFLYDDIISGPKEKLQVEVVEQEHPSDSLQTKKQSAGDSSSQKSSNDKADAQPDTKTGAQSDAKKLSATVTNPVKYGPLTDDEKDRIRKEAVKYEEKDQRIRTGGYYIRGLDFEVRVRQGDDLKRIARHTIGEELVCYLAAYNDMRETDALHTGQIIRIPKLILKKRVLK